MVDHRRLANLLAAPVFGTFVLYILVGRGYVQGSLGPTLALTFEALLVGLMLFVIVSDLSAYVRKRRESE